MPNFLLMSGRLFVLVMPSSILWGMTVFGPRVLSVSGFLVVSLGRIFVGGLLSLFAGPYLVFSGSIGMGINT